MKFGIATRAPTMRTGTAVTKRLQNIHLFIKKWFGIPPFRQCCDGWQAFSLVMRLLIDSASRVRSPPQKAPKRNRVSRQSLAIDSADLHRWHCERTASPARPQPAAQLVNPLSMDIAPDHAQATVDGNDAYRLHPDPEHRHRAFRPMVGWRERAKLPWRKT
ncbi:hypothetical protein [Xanthomonas maliensis]|nr:hypothetical protein [Xanthomonas maliensis]